MRRVLFGLVGYLWWGCQPVPQRELEIAEMTVRRVAPSFSAAVLDTLPAGLQVAEMRSVDTWIEVCYRGIKGWIPADFLPGEPLPGSLIAEAPDDSVAIALRSSPTPSSDTTPTEEATYVRLRELLPWHVPDSFLYAGFYEGLPGEEIGLIVVNLMPRLSLTIKYLQIEEENLQEVELPLTGEVALTGNLIQVTHDEAPFQRAEFVRMGRRRGLLLKRKEGEYSLLWRHSS
ncbi:MAG: SH3 domain-containing protein [Bacteroidia bacterium]|nr:SH3 domain-containing protein [Bacteroidia bacterium]MDW8088653.1 SH3 domain-containing protein [Bacteroidia bacterium]